MERKPEAPDRYAEQLTDPADFIHRACAFTGHRPAKFPWKYDEADSRCIALISALTEQIRLLAKAGVTDFFSGMAEGTDCYCSQIVLTLREINPALKLHCVLPHKGQADNWTASSRELYHSILDQADSIVYVSRAYHKNCMLDRNRFLIDHASTVLAVYNGIRRSGTGATVNYARKMGREIIVIDPVTLEITHEGPASNKVL